MSKEVSLFENAKVTPNSLKMAKKITMEAWTAIGEQLQAIEGGVMWWIGDWLNHGELVFGESYAQAVDVTNYSIETLRQAKRVSARFARQPDSSACARAGRS